MGSRESLRLSYRNDGYVILNGFFLRSNLQKILEEAKDVFVQQMAKPGDGWSMDGMVNLFRENQKVFQNCGKQCQHLINLHRIALSDAIIKLLHEIADIHWPVICTRPVMYFNHPDLAVSRLYHTVDAHQDWRSMQGSSNACVLWAPLTDCPVNLGALKVLPRSHLNGLRTESINGGFGMVKLTEEERLRMVQLPCEQGDAVLFHSMLIHESGDNVTDQPRWSCHFRYNDLDDPTFQERGFVHPYIYKPVEDLL